MELPVYTALLKVERRIGQVGHLELPRMVTLTEAGVFGGTFLLLVGGSWLLRLSPVRAWLFLYLVIPYGAAYFASRPVADRKPFHLWALSQIRYFLAEPRVLARLAPVREPGSVRVRIGAWASKPVADAAPAPVPDATPEPAPVVVVAPASEPVAIEGHPMRALAPWRMGVQPPAVRVLPVASAHRSARQSRRMSWAPYAAALAVLALVSAALGSVVVALARVVA